MPEQQLLLDFFQACRVYDTTVLARLTTVPCNPRTDGIVQEFDVVRVDRDTDTRKVTIRRAESDRSKVRCQNKPSSSPWRAATDAGW